MLDIIRALKEAGIRPGLTTGGREITEALASRIAEARLYAASVSIDGLESTHDLIRAAPGSFASASTCRFAATCLAGCSFTEHSLFGRPGNNPSCHYRARTLARQGLRERLIPKAPAPGRPFDNGLFELLVEPLDAPDPRPPTPRELVRKRKWAEPAAS